MEQLTTQNVFRENHYGISVCGVDEIKRRSNKQEHHEFPVDPVIFAV